MCHALARAGANVDLVSPKCREVPGLGNQTIWEYHQIEPKIFTHTFLHHIDVRIPHLTQFIMAWSFSLAVLYYLVKNKANVVHVFNDAREVLLLLKLISFWYRPKVVFELHMRPAGFYDKVLEKLVLSVVDLLLVTTNEFKDHYKTLGFPGENIEVFPNGVDLADFDFKMSKEALRHELKLPQNAFIVGYGGRFITMGMEKGIPELIKATKLLTKKHKNIKLVCVGGPNDYVSKYLKESNGQAIILGDVPRKEMYKYMKSFDICAMPFPNTEHFAHNMSPLKTFEYMASGNPIIASNLPTIREILTDHKNALLVEPGSVQDLAKKLETLIINPREGKKLALNAYSEVAKKYSWVSRGKTEIKCLKKMR